MGTTTEYFARKASGLARSVSARDALIFNIMWMAPLGPWIYGIWALSLFPGADLPMTVLISEVVALIVGAFYAVFNASMPRSGGDYIWNSRVLHPVIGFSMNFFFNMALLSSRRLNPVLGNSILFRANVRRTWNARNCSLLEFQ